MKNTNQVLATYQGEGWHANENVEMSTKDEYTTLIIRDSSPNAKARTKEIRFRNVGAINESSAIQFEVTTYGKQTRTVYFHVPHCMVELFISQLGKQI